MKNKSNILNIKIFLFLCLSVVVFNACQADEELFEKTRLFRPVLTNGKLEAEENTVIVNMGKLKEAIRYKVEISRDTFKTIVKTIEGPENNVVFRELVWNALYQVRATAYAADENFNSKVSDLGAIKTQRFPSILEIPLSIDIIDIGINVRWAVSGLAVTDVKFFSPLDEEFLTPLSSYATTTTEKTTGLKTIKTLMPATRYTVAIYSGTTLRGYETFTTKAALTVTGTPIDLRNKPVDNTTLSAAFSAATDGQTIILDGDSTYTLNANIILDKSVVLKSGFSLSTGGAIVDIGNGASQFEIGGSGTYSIVFDGINFQGSSAVSKYIFNGGTTSSATITDLKLLNCTIYGFRDIIRIRSAWNSGSIGTFTIDNCKVSTLGNTGMILTDSGAATASIKNIVLTKSTFFDIQKLIYLRSTNSATCNVVIADCTFYEASKTVAMIEATTTGHTITGLEITNSIFGRGITTGAPAVSPATPYDYALTRNVAATPTLGNNYMTNDFNFLAPIPATITLFSGDAVTLWTDPINGNFRIKASNFVGKSSAGDPRWRL